MHAPTPILLLGPLLTLTAAISMDCAKIVEDKQRWDLSKLGGQHTVHSLQRIQSGSQNYHNTTYTLDICAPLKDQPKGCEQGTRVCRSLRTFHEDSEYDPKKPDEKKLPPIDEAYAVAGEFVHGHGGALDPYFKRLRGSESHEDNKKEGVRVSMYGGVEENHEGLGRVQQRAIVEFLCDRERTGLEGPGTKEERRVRVRDEKDDDDKKDDDKKGDDEDDDDKDGDDKDGDDNDGDDLSMPSPDEGASLRFLSYKIEGQGKDEYGTLRLEWRTKYACEDAKDAPDDDKDGGSKKGSKGWGFFTWFIIILFLAIASYLIFGSWLNYNRYGARGWDLLPHGDTIRDIPYLLKDWARRVFSGGALGSSRDLGYIRV